MIIPRIHALTMMLALVALLGLSGLANAQMMGPGMMGGNMYGLTPEKQAAAQKIYTDFYAKTATMRQQLNAKQYELNVQVNNPGSDEKKVQALSKEVADISAKLYEAQAAFQNQLAKEGIPAMGGMAMMGGPGMHHGMGMGCCW